MDVIIQQWDICARESERQFACMQLHTLIKSMYSCNNLWVAMSESDEDSLLRAAISPAGSDSASNSDLSELKECISLEKFRIELLLTLDKLRDVAQSRFFRGWKFPVFAHFLENPRWLGNLSNSYTQKSIVLYSIALAYSCFLGLCTCVVFLVF